MSYLIEELPKYDLPTFIGKCLATVDPGASYLPNWHIRLIAEYLEAARFGKIHRLIINMPPRSLKSLCVSVAWPAWLMGHDPRSRILAASYSSNLSIKHSLDCRLVVNSHWYKRLFPNVSIAHDQNEKHKFMTTERGFRLATSIDGTTTGEGGNFLILDDPVSPAQAVGEHWRGHVNQWFDHTFASRLDDKQKGVIVLVMQRLHMDDMTGYLLAKGGWEHLCLPAAAVKPEVHHFGNTYKARGIGELLHPERENMQLIERARIELGSAVFSAQYQQQPVPQEGAMVRLRWFGRYKEAPEGGRRVQSWDTAIKSGLEHDASVCLTFLEQAGRSFLLDARVLRREYPDLKRDFYALAGQWQPNAILLEDRASGQQLLQDVRRETCLPVISMQPKGDKEARFGAACAMIEAGRVVLPEDAPWLADFEKELAAFPGGSHDDQVDALSQYLDWIRGGTGEKLGIRRV